MVICYLGIGSNLGDRRKTIESAIKKVAELKGTKVIKASKLIETKPQGGPAGQPKFLNGALKVETNLSPHSLLKSLKEIERELGRKRTVRFGPRTIDLDILLYANRRIKTSRLTVPHPRMFEREFVMGPLFDILRKKRGQATFFMGARLL